MKIAIDQDSVLQYVFNECEDADDNHAERIVDLDPEWIKEYQDLKRRINELEREALAAPDLRD
jgi:hypothetical protein